jgi:hypothetical protein
MFFDNDKRKQEEYHAIEHLWPHLETHNEVHIHQTENLDKLKAILQEGPVPH